MKQSSVYLGPPEKQRNPAAENKWQGKKNNAQARQAPPPTRPLVDKTEEEIDAIREKHNETFATGSPFDDSIFARGISVVENRAQDFKINCSAYDSLLNETFRQMTTDNVNLQKQMHVEYFRYYGTFLLWARIVSLKAKNQLVLFTEERWLIDTLSLRSYNVPKSILTYLTSLGNIVTVNGQHLKPNFDSLPTTLVDNRPGFYGPIHQHHNLYKELPCLGTYASAVQQALTAAAGVYVSPLTKPTHVANGFLLGYHPLLTRRTEANALAQMHGITEHNFRESIAATGLNIDFIN